MERKSIGNLQGALLAASGRVGMYTKHGQRGAKTLFSEIQKTGLPVGGPIQVIIAVQLFCCCTLVDKAFGDCVQGNIGRFFVFQGLG